MDGMMRTGAFAALCGTTKETLRHYRQVGVLRPAAEAPNGYRLYAATQMTDFFLIEALQAAGLSLAEIREFRETASGTEFRRMLAAQVEALEEQRRKIDRELTLLRNTMARFDATEQLAGDLEPRLVEVGEEYFLETETPCIDGAEDVFLARAGEHLAFCRDHDLTEAFQSSYRIRRDAFEARDYGAGFSFLARVAEPVDSPRLHVKPAGTYLRWPRALRLDPALADALASGLLEVPPEESPSAAEAQAGERLGDAGAQIDGRAGNARAGISGRSGVAGARIDERADAARARIDERVGDADSRPDAAGAQASERPGASGAGAIATASTAEEAADDLLDAYDAMHAWIDANGWEIDGDAYDTEYTPYTGNLAETFYLVAEVRVRPKR